jgi:hypothetical protein
MSHRKIVAIIVIILAIVALEVVVLTYIRNRSSSPRAAAPIIAKRYKIVLQESKLDPKQEDFSDENIKTYFSKEIIDAHTYNFLQYLDQLVSEETQNEDPLETIRAYLNARLPPEQAEKMFDLYSLYLDYQVNWQEQLKYQAMPRSPEEALENLADLQEYRRAVFGQESADMIFGASVEAQEYAIRRNMILYNDALYAAEKEEQLKALGDAMWGDDLASGDGGAAYTRYQQKLQLYKKDLAELRTEEERRAFLQNLNLETFDPVQRQALEEAQQATAEEQRRKEQYYAKERELLNDLYLNEEQRAQKIKELQDATFGDQADAFRRREAMRVKSNPANK